MSGLLRSWSLTLDGDFLTLLTRLDVESSPQVCWLHTQHAYGFMLESIMYVPLGALFLNVHSY